MLRQAGVNPSHPHPKRGEKSNLNFNFHTFLWCLKRFYEGLKGFHKTFMKTSKRPYNIFEVLQSDVKT